MRWMLVPMRKILVLLALLVTACGKGQDRPMPEAIAPLSAPIVIAHRGASGERPEHTLGSYERAIEQGADFIEPDLVPTKDDVLVARHENEISETTDVAAHPEFAARRATKTIDGQKMTGWFVEDFTLAELKTLRAKERLPLLRPENRKYDGQFEIPTLAEIIALAKRHHVGIYPETKHPTYFASIGHPTDELLVKQLQAAGWNTPDAPVFIQSFEVENLKRIHQMTGIRLIQLVDKEGGPADGAAPSYAAMLTPEGLRDIATYAFGIGPNKSMLWDGKLPTGLISAAHAAGLRVHPWTYRAENYFLPSEFRNGLNPREHGDLDGEIKAALRRGLDGFFSDFPGIGVKARDEVQRERKK